MKIRRRNCSSLRKRSPAKLLLENEKFSDSISRSYYGMFHAAKALLLEKD
jgi:uncharacterized protein (UPF0332 family)